jgi:soluble lytic murein transglycosylase-like protein
MGGDFSLIWRSTAGQSKTKRSAMDRLKHNRSRFSPLIDRIAKQTSLQPALVHAVIRAESAYNPKAISSAGAVGLMQLMPATAAQYGITDLTNPVDNIRAGSLYLKKQLDHFKDLSLALAAYNAGENAVRRYGNTIPPFPETQRYVKKVLTFYQQNR